MPVSDGGVVVEASGAGGVSDGVGLGAGSAGAGAGVVVSAGGVVISALSSFLAQPAASHSAETATKARARILNPPQNSNDERGPLLSGQRSRWFQNMTAPSIRIVRCQCFVNARRHRISARAYHAALTSALTVPVIYASALNIR